MNTFQDLYNHVHDWLRGAATVTHPWKGVLQVFYATKAHHNGLRNGNLPEFIHQLEMAADVIRFFEYIENPEVVMALVLSHDTLEDPNQKTKEYFPVNRAIGLMNYPIVEKLITMSKEVEGVKNEDYSLDVIFGDVDTSIAKALDRKSNVNGMYGIFKLERLQRYIKETEEEFIPRMMNCITLYPNQAFIYSTVLDDIQLSLANIKARLNDGEGYKTEAVL